MGSGESESDRTKICPVIPVLDLMIGQIVLAQGGNRDRYLPVESRLIKSSDPVAVARAMFQQTGCDCLYLADIDSFSGAMPNWNVYRDLLETGFGLWVDADWLSGDRYLQIADRIERPERFKVIVSSETMQTDDQFEVFDRLLQLGMQTVFSLDKKGEHVIVRPTSSLDDDPLALIEKAWDAGVRDLIVLDLSLVGTLGADDRKRHRTETQAMIEKINQCYSGATIISGGGVATANDVQMWLDAGCDHVLVASAIHDCRLTPDEIDGLRAS